MDYNNLLADFFIGFTTVIQSVSAYHLVKIKMELNRHRSTIDYAEAFLNVYQSGRNSSGQSDAPAA